MAGTVFIKPDPEYYNPNAQLGLYIIPTMDGLGRTIERDEYFKYFDKVVGKLVAVDKERGLYKVLIKLG
jgi:hypothetical protein